MRHSEFNCARLEGREATRPVFIPMIHPRNLRLAWQLTAIVVIFQLSVVQAMASSGAFHKHLHDHADEPGHECAATLMIQGGYDVVVPRNRAGGLRCTTAGCSGARAKTESCRAVPSDRRDPRTRTSPGTVVEAGSSGRRFVIFDNGVGI